MKYKWGKGLPSFSQGIQIKTTVVLLHNMLNLRFISVSGWLGTGDYVEVARALRCLHFPEACVSLIDTVWGWAAGRGDSGCVHRGQSHRDLWVARDCGWRVLEGETSLVCFFDWLALLSVVWIP